MKYTVLLLLCAFMFVGGLESTFAQDSKKKEVRFRPIQKSPTDMTYFRDGRSGPVHARVIYGRPYKKDREVFGKLVPFGKVWRTGADEASEITFYKDVVFGGKEIKAGTYALFTIPNKDSWDVILNSGLHQWGAFTYDAKLDVARVKAKVEMMDKALENFSIAFSGGNMIMAWDKTKVPVSIKVK